MSSADMELEQQLKEAGKQLSHPPASVDELFTLLDQVEKLLSKVDQSPNKSMLDALDPSMKALVKEGLLKHSDVDVKVAVASCISEITRITAPDAPYSDDQMRDIFQLIVSSFEKLSDVSSRSYNKRASILETVSKVRSCVVMLDLECDGLIVEMFQHFLKSVREHHNEGVYSSMENIMALVLEESEFISVEMLKPLLASVKNNNEGVLSVARKLGEAVLQKSAEKIRPYLIPTLKSMGDSLDSYSQVVACICEGTTVVEHNDENLSEQHHGDESKLAKGSDDTPQTDESKLITASSHNADQVVRENSEGPSPEEVDPNLGRSLKSTMSNGMVIANEEASSKKPVESINQLDPKFTSKVDTDDSVAEKSTIQESKPEQTSKRRGKKSDIDREKVAEKPTDSQKSSSKDVHRSPGKESSMEAVIPSEIEKETNAPISSPKAMESDAAKGPSPSQSASLADGSRDTKVGRSKKKQVLPQQEEDEAANADGSRSKKSVRLKFKSLSHEDTPSMNVSSKTPEGTTDSETKPQRRAGKKAPVVKEDKLPDVVGTSEDGKDTGDSDEELLKKPNKKVDSKSAKQLGKKVGAGDSEAKKPKQSGKKMDTAESEETKPKRDGKKVNAEGEPSRQSLKNGDENDSDAKPIDLEGKRAKQSGKKMGAAGLEEKKPKKAGKKVDEDKLSKESVKKGDESDSDAKPLKQSGKKGNKSGVETKTSKQSLKKKDEGNSGAKPLRQSGKKVEKGEGSDSEMKLNKLSTKKVNTSKSAEVKSTSKKKEDGKKHARGKNVTEEEQAKSMSTDDEMDVSPKSASKSAKGEGDLEETPATSSKRKSTASKDKVSEVIKYDDSLVGQKVKVWWPEDKMYYEGVIESFDSAKKKHKVNYIDGDEEILNLKTQKWEILKEFSARDEEQATEDPNAEGSPETHKKKKSKTESGPPASTKDSAKRAGGTSVSGKSKGSSSKSARTSKDEPKVDKLKNSGKSVDKVSLKSNEDEEKETPKTSTKTINKSKGKSNASTSSKAKPSSSSNPKESEDDVKTPESAKGKSTEVSKTGSKSAKKRKRRG